MKTGNACEVALVESICVICVICGWAPLGREPIRRLRRFTQI